jgi:Flp pilus assembly protein TadG
MRTGSRRAQALLELALCAPIVIVLAVGTASAVQLASAREGLEGATQAAANAAARAPDPATAVAAAQSTFASVIAGYPLGSASLALSMGDFKRTGHIGASASARVDLGWAAFALLPTSITLRSHVVVRLEPWRSHRPPG